MSGLLYSMDREKGPRLYNPRGLRSQREVGRILGISQSRVMQLERRALWKLVKGLQADSDLQKLADEAGAV